MYFVDGLVTNQPAESFRLAFKQSSVTFTKQDSIKKNHASFQRGMADKNY